MIRSMLAVAALSMTVAAFAQEPTAPAASAPAASAPAASAPAASGKKTKAECKKEGVKGKKALKECMSGK